MLAQAVPLVWSADGTPTPQTTLWLEMSFLADHCYWAGWRSGWEYDLWRVLETGPQAVGGDHITQDDSNRLRQLAQAADGWYTYDACVPMAVWNVEYATVTSRS